MIYYEKSLRNHTETRGRLEAVIHEYEVIIKMSSISINKVSNTVFNKTGGKKEARHRITM